MPSKGIRILRDGLRFAVFDWDATLLGSMGIEPLLGYYLPYSFNTISMHITAANISLRTGSSLGTSWYISNT